MSQVYEKNVYLAMLAEQCNRFDEMVQFLASVDNKAAQAAFLVESRRSKDKRLETTCDGIHGIK